MQQQMEQIQSDLAKKTVEATSGGGAVKVVAKCDGTIGSLKIDPQALNPSDAQLLEDMILSAANQALGQAKEISNAEMGKVTAGFNLPGFSKQSLTSCSITHGARPGSSERLPFSTFHPGAMYTAATFKTVFSRGGTR